jgi:hypothetical protein
LLPAGPQWVRKITRKAKKLTHNRIAGLKCPEGKRDMRVFDDEQRGLGMATPDAASLGDLRGLGGSYLVARAEMRTLFFRITN